MRLLEYEAKQIITSYGISIPDGQVLAPREEFEISTPVMLKAQIPLGGRGKAGGILPADTGAEAHALADHLFSRPLRGLPVKQILMESRLETTAEYYLGITYDTVKKAPVAIFAREGGVEIEQQAAAAPTKVCREHFEIRRRLPAYRAREIVSATGLSGKPLLMIAGVLSKLADIFIDCDATLAEINPLALTADQRVVALDCHLELDDDALFRQRSVVAQVEARATAAVDSSTADADDMDNFARRAEQIDNLDHRGVAGRFIPFDGNLGLLIGGGGASLTAFDAIRAHGGRPANYCEVGGNPSVRKVKELTKLLLSKPGVEKIAVIMNVVSNTRVDLMARGIVKGILEAGKVPSETVATFRVPGAWEDEGYKILTKYGIEYADRTVSIDEAAALAVRRLQSELATN